MISKYIKILMESLEKKEVILNAIVQANQRQADILKAESLDMDEFDKNADEKSNLITELDSLDQGFEAVYERIRSELLANKDNYKSEIAILQQQISNITDLGVTIQTQEARNKQAAEKSFQRARTAINSGKSSSKIAMDYYKTMNQMNHVGPQFMDKKK